MLGRVKGFTLIEVLVAVLLLSIGLLGLASLQTWGLRMTGNAMHLSQATLFAHEMVERIRANAAGTKAGAYGNLATPNCQAGPECFSVTPCTPNQLADDDYFAVMCGGGEKDGAGLDDLLPPGSQLQVTNCASLGSQCRIEVSWFEVADNFSPSTQAEQRSVVVEFVP